MTAGGLQAERQLVVRADPRALQDGVTLAQLKEQFDHNIRARGCWCRR
ncbi:MAG: hypothetical protein U0163_20185 [Gemmatimonadaceae bacterium]